MPARTTFAYTFTHWSIGKARIDKALNSGSRQKMEEKVDE